MNEFDDVMNVGHGMLTFHCYEVDAEGRERALYASDWEAPGSFIEGAS